MINLNGVTAIASLMMGATPTPGLNTAQTVTTIYDLVYQNSGISLDILKTDNQSPEFSMQLIA